MPLGSGIVYRLYEKGIRRGLKPDALPHHVAMIVDGNRRWARQRMLESAAHGHRAGAAKIQEFLGWCDDLDIRVVTLYLLSNDNLTGRASEELNELFEIIAQLIDDLSSSRDWRIKHVGTSEKDRKSTRLNSSHANISYAVFCLKKKKGPEAGRGVKGAAACAC